MPDTSFTLYPELQPYDHGYLNVSGGHSLYFEQCGNPKGVPVLFLHGGPGSGCNPGQRRFFDPCYYRIILTDQRGCGRSLPLGEVEENSTEQLVEDIERLRSHLNVAQWLVFGGSWGSTLALAYAARHPQPITGLILRGIFLGRRSEIDWFLSSVRHFFPEACDRLMAPIPLNERGDILQAYYRRVFAGDIEAARNWNAFESSIMRLIPPTEATTDTTDDALTLGRARVQLHYIANQCFLEDQPLLDQVDRYRHIPAMIIQGRYDMVCPPVSAYELHRAWPEASFVIIPDAGHSAMEPGIISALVAATEQFKQMQ